MKKKILLPIALMMLIITSVLIHFSVDAKPFNADVPPEDGDSEIEVVNPYFSILHTTLTDGTPIGAYIINGPPKPPAEFEEERLASLVQDTGRSTIANFPSYNWVFGCSAVSGAMIAGYYDNNGYPNMYTGLTNGGDMPITDTSWPTWTDSVTDVYPNNPLVASHNGVDGRTTRGSIDDYWVSYFSGANDPFITNGWVEHTWGTAIGDFMKTSQSSYGNVDGSTNFYYLYNNSKLTCDLMEDYDIDDFDGTYGRKLFYEARGYAVGECYSQNTDNNYTGGFSLADFQAEIDAGHPVLLNLAGHSIVGFGYDGETIYVRDTWDSNPSNVYYMTWGGAYPPGHPDAMELRSVSVVHLESPVTPPLSPTGVLATDGTYTDKVRVSWISSTGSTSYKVFRNTSNTTAGAQELTSSHPTSPYDDTSAVPGQLYYYWVQACNSGGCSGFSLSDSGFKALTAPTSISASDGAFTDKVQVTWPSSTGATSYFVYRNTSNIHSGETELGSVAASPFDDTSAVQDTNYYYWVKACSSVGCSDYSSSDLGYAASEISIPEAPTNVAATDGTYTDKVRVSWDSSLGASYYRVFRNTSDNTSGAQELTGSHPASPFDDFTSNPGDTYYYWAKACNTAGCSEYSLYNTGWRAVAGTDYLIYLPLIMGGTGTSTSPIANGDFEQGHVAWTEDSNYGYYLIYEFDPGEAHSGTWLAYLLGQDIDNGVDRLSQTVTIPTTQPYLHFWYYIYSQDACNYDFARVKVNGTTKATLNLCSTNNTSDWRSYTVNLSAYAGNTVTLMFEATSDDVLDSYFYLDDILLSSSSSVYNIDKDSQQELDFSNLTKYKYP